MNMIFFFFFILKDRCQLCSEFLLTAKLNSFFVKLAIHHQWHDLYLVNKLQSRVEMFLLSWYSACAVHRVLPQLLCVACFSLILCNFSTFLCLLQCLLVNAGFQNCIYAGVLATTKRTWMSLWSSLLFRHINISFYFICHKSLSFSYYLFGIIFSK